MAAPVEPSSSARGHRYREVMRAYFRAVEGAFTAWAHRFVLRQHEPVDVGLPDAPELVCTNHWRPRVQPWPCSEVVREMARWDEAHCG